MRMPPLAALLAFALATCGCTPAPRAWTERLTGIRMVPVPAGELTMGSPAGETGREPQEVPHRVRLARPFFMAAPEVTQEQWRRVMGTAPSWFARCGARCPVERVTWHDAQRFVARLNELTSRRFRLPTEEEWEYACRAGTTTPFHTGADLTTNQANYDGRGPYAGSAAGSFRGTPTPVGSFAPNAWGLFDMHGNVWEWCADAYEEGGDGRVVRGGCWFSEGGLCRAACRLRRRAGDRDFNIGFRVALDASPAGG